ncbi:MAG: UDP-N-acetylglucosamine 1-carboxyvinyltransferase [Eubacteriaceae bacterium]|jgi:UDP-N-acetylglucosamine 1-carboxyvinyltransferase|nr:UDP-N-acetylglucosamine 1-carboxyvinyltransferase [Eubacteriaceae bacterium]
MSKYIVNGRKRLEGELSVQGAKNSALPIMAACVLNSGETVLHNVPDILDVRIMVKILTSIGCTIKRDNVDLSINARGLTSNLVSEQLVSQMRSSIMLLGALIAQQKVVQFSFPGGCDIGLRPIDIHLKGLRDLGADVREEHGFIMVDGSGISANNIILNYPSVGATENLILATIFAPGVTSISNAAKEPEIIDLQNFLNGMGARVYGAGTNTIYVEGVEKLHDSEYTIMADRIVAGTMLCAVNITGGRVFFKDLPLDVIKAPYFKLMETGMQIQPSSGGIVAESAGKIKAVDSIITQPFPGFPTDLQSPFAAMLTLAEGTSVIKEAVFENRYKYTVQLARMGANIKTEDRIAIITGVKRLGSACVYAEDLRGGAALIVAALAAEGTSVIENAYHINRGYDNLASQIRSIGGEAVYVDES